MAKLRQNHAKSGKQPFAGMALRIFILLGLLGVLFVWVYNVLNNADTFSSDDIANAHQRMESSPDNEAALLSLVPEGNTSDVTLHRYYILGYNEAHEQADWVAYKLTKEELRIPNVPRAKRFNEDRAISTRSAKHSDYTRSGYSRGHMVPAGDMAFNEEAMQETFYMSNMSPQLTGFNGGIWRELEESVRDWAYEYDELFVASGPIFNDVTKYIGQTSKVRVPSAFYKVIVDDKGRKPKGIGFIIPHEVSDQSLKAYAMSIDELEEKVGLDFFDEVYTDELHESQIETTYDMSKWPLSKKRFNNRISNWNNN